MVALWGNDDAGLYDRGGMRDCIIGSKHLLAIHGITCRGPLHGAPARGQAETAHGTPAHDTPEPA